MPLMSWLLPTQEWAQLQIPLSVPQKTSISSFSVDFLGGKLNQDKLQSPLSTPAVVAAGR